MDKYKDLADGVLVRRISNTIAIYIAKIIVFLRKCAPPLLTAILCVGTAFA